MRDDVLFSPDDAVDGSAPTERTPMHPAAPPPKGAALSVLHWGELDEDEEQRPETD